MNQLIVEMTILEFLNSPEYRPVKPSVIAKKLGFEAEQFRDIRRLIKRMAREGKVVFLANHLVGPVKPGVEPSKAPKSRRRRSPADQEDKGSLHEVRPAAESNLQAREDGDAGEFDPPSRVQSGSASPSLRGTLKLTSGGFGFVRLLTTGEASVSQSSSDEIFIPPPALGSAMDGDLVLVKTRFGRQGKLEGRIVEVLERAKRQFPGTYQLQGGKSGVWLDGVQPAVWIQVGDIRGLPVEQGDKVMVEVVRYPTEHVIGEGVIMEVLGSSRNPAVDTLAVMRQFGLEEAFPEEVIEDARGIADLFEQQSASPLVGRRDLTQVPTLTIDPVDARDFDDAISLTKNEVGNWELQVHIADVAHFVPEGSRLDEEAKQRATSVYLPDKVIPMLPEIISNHLASLQPDQARFAKTVLMEFDPHGTLVHWDVYNAVIRNAQRLNYEQVDQYLANPEPWRAKLEPAIWQLLADMHELAMILRGKRVAGGAIELSLPEVKIDLDRMGKVKGAHLVINTVSHQIIEEFMLAANQTVATWLDDLEVPFLHRVHPVPKRDKIKRLTEFIRSLGIDCGELLDRFELQRVVDSVRGTGSEYGVNYAILKSLSKAVYQPEVDRHYALNMAHYCHFTSPIRRYPDLVVHRVVEELLQRGWQGVKHRHPVPSGELDRSVDPRGVGLSMGVLVQLGYHCSEQEQNAEAAERELVRVKLLHYMSRRVGEFMVGTICNLRPDGFLVSGDELPVEGFVPMESLPLDRYRYDRQTHVIEGLRHGNSYRLGDSLRVKIERVDLAKRELIFVVDPDFAVTHTSMRAKSKNRPASSAKTKGRDGVGGAGGQNRGPKGIRGATAKGGFRGPGRSPSKKKRPRRGRG